MNRIRLLSLQMHLFQLCIVLWLSWFPLGSLFHLQKVIRQLQKLMLGWIFADKFASENRHLFLQPSILLLKFIHPASHIRKPPQQLRIILLQILHLTHLDIRKSSSFVLTLLLEKFNFLLLRIDLGLQQFLSFIGVDQLRTDLEVLLFGLVVVCPLLVDLLLHPCYLLLDEDVVLLEVILLLSNQVFEEIDLLLENLHLLHVHFVLDL